MRIANVLAIITIAALSQFMSGTGRAQDIDSMAPVVVKTLPESGAKDVAPGVVEIKVTFSKEMADGSWSPLIVWQGSTPEAVENPRYGADHKTWVLKVRLEPGKTYGYWLNKSQFQNFKDKQGHSAIPYLLVFQTKGN